MRYDLHMHSKYSRDSLNEPRDILKMAKKRGLDGVAVTDHDTIKGGQAAYKLRKRYGVDVIHGVEVKSSIGDVLCYYVNEEVKSRDFPDLIDEVKAMGGLISIAHPFTGGTFRKPAKVDLNDLPKGVDAIECFNARMVFSSANLKAHVIAKKNGLAMTAGSDAHFLREIGRAYTEFEGDLRRAIRKRMTEVHGTNRNAFWYRNWTLKNILLDRMGVKR